MPRSFVGSCHHLRGFFRHHPEDGTIGSSETLLTICMTKRHHDPENHNQKFIAMGFSVHFADLCMRQSVFLIS